MKKPCRSIFLGETFSSYLSVRNDSRETVTEVLLKAELQAGQQRTMLTSADQQPLAQLAPEDSLDDIVNHEVKDLGVHMFVQLRGPRVEEK